MIKTSTEKFKILNAAVILLTAALFLSSCEKESDEVIDPSFASPVLTDLLISRDTVYTTSSAPSINLIARVNADLNGGSLLSKVTCTVYDPAGQQAGVFQLADNGQLPDTTAGDMIYSGSINIGNIQCLLVGNYSMELLAVNTSGLNSNLLTESFTVVNTANQPPVITSTNLPDSVVRPLPGDSALLTISINSSDPDGICDLRNVSFVTVRPDGQVLPAIPMFNQGNGVFSFSNYVSYSTNPSSYGYFKYTFTATDNSGAQSVPVRDSIKFIAPG